MTTESTSTTTTADPAAPTVTRMLIGGEPADAAAGRRANFTQSFSVVSSTSAPAAVASRDKAARSDSEYS
jgi:hypothetical protein